MKHLVPTNYQEQSSTFVKSPQHKLTAKESMRSHLENFWYYRYIDFDVTTSSRGPEHKKKLAVIIRFHANVILSEAVAKSWLQKQQGSIGSEFSPALVQKSVYITEIFGNNKSSNGKADWNNHRTARHAITASSEVYRVSDRSILSYKTKKTKQNPTVHLQARSIPA